MTRCFTIVALFASALLALAGCATGVAVPASALSGILAEVDVSPPTAEEMVLQRSAVVSPSPFSVRDQETRPGDSPVPWDMTIDEAIQVALANSTVLRNLGARVVQTPSLTPTIYGPSIQATDPTTGIEAALSEFDAQVNGDFFYEDNDRLLNNEFLGEGVNDFKQDLSQLESSISKQTASGTLFTLRHNFDADRNNSDQNLIKGRAWNWDFEGEFSQPLLQGRGVMFNRIAGPNATPGVFNGVIIARLNADITAAQLEIALRDFLSDVENAYWDLYFAYSDLEIKKAARDRSLNTYRLLKARKDLPGAEKDKLAQAKEQYFRFEQDVQNALAGRLVVGTRTFNGSGGGTFQGTGGVYVAERRLRMIMGIPINEGRLIRTVTVPTDAPLAYDWDDVVSNGLARRTEVRQQRLKVDRRHYELTASRNFLLPRVDAVGRYRYRALGESYFDGSVPIKDVGVGTGTHEWLMGVSLAYPVGFRQAHAGVRNAQLRLARERAVLTELERQVVYGLSNAIAECDRAYSVLRMAINREQAASEQYEILHGEAQAPVRQFDFNALLDSEQRLAEASAAASRARVQYALATKNLNFEMGSLLEYFNIHMGEGGRSQNVTRSTGRAGRLFRSFVDRTRPKNLVAAFTPSAASGSGDGAATTAVANLKDADEFGQTIVGEDQINAIIERELTAGERVASRPDPAADDEDTAISPSDLQLR